MRQALAPKSVWFGFAPSLCARQAESEDAARDRRLWLAACGNRTRYRLSPADVLGARSLMTRPTLMNEIPC